MMSVPEAPGGTRKSLEENDLEERSGKGCETTDIVRKGIGA